MQIWIQPEGPKQLSRALQNLRILSLHNIHEECDLTWTTFFLEAAPLLEKIYIEVSYRFQLVCLFNILIYRNMTMCQLLSEQIFSASATVWFCILFLY